jgi:hypothetical protein
MDFEGASKELYRAAPFRFTATRDALATRAREAGDRELASSLKKLRKPSVGAWLANLLVLEQSVDVEHLVNLGAELRTQPREVEGSQIRKVSKLKSEAISQLVKDAASKASREGQSVSAAASQELEATLDAAFADPEAAASLLQGRLTSGLRYSGLGFSMQIPLEDPSGRESAASARASRPEAETIAARRSLETANRDADQADARLEKARRAVADADHTLTQRKLAEAKASQQSDEAHAKASAARQTLRSFASRR